MNRRLISIDYLIVQEALKSKKTFDALTFVLQLKANYANSAMYQWSYRKIMSVCHCNFSKAKEVVSTAISKGWVVEQETKEGYKYLVAVKLTRAKQNKLVFQVAESKAGVQIYFSKKQHVSLRGLRGDSKEQKAARLVLTSLAACDFDSYAKAQKATTIQSFKDVRHKILEAIFLKYVDRFEDSPNTNHRRSVGVNKKANTTFHETYKMFGVSYRTIAKQFGNLHLTEYQISNIVVPLKKQGLVRTNKANCLFFKEVAGINDISDDFSEFLTLDEETGKVKNEFRRCFHNKYITHNEGERLYYKRYARTYHSNAYVEKYAKRKGVNK